MKRGVGADARLEVVRELPHRPVWSNMTAVEEFIFCMVTLASVSAL